MLYGGKLSGLLSVGGGREDRSVEFRKTTTGACDRRIRAKRGEFTDRWPPRIPLDSALSPFSVDGSAMVSAVLATIRAVNVETRARYVTIIIVGIPGY